MVTGPPEVVRPGVRLLPMGERAVLAEVADLAAVLSLHAALADDPPVGVDDLVPAARTVLVAFDPARVSREVVRAWILDAARRTPDAGTSGPLVEVPVRYDGADLASTAELLGIPVSELVSRHAGVEWTVAFSGFAPGFAYLVSAAWPYDVPRLAEPRTRVPTGAVGLAGGFSGAYPRETPGGWRLIGATDAVLFDPDATAPVLLPPRARVRFVPERPRIIAASEPVVDPEPVEGSGPASTTRGAPSPTSGGHSGGGGPDAAAVSSRAGIPSAPVPGVGPMASASPSEVPAAAGCTDPPRPALRVVIPGAFTTVQDLGRPGLAALGVARSGTLDRATLRAANRLVGNDEGAAGLEIAMGGFVARAEADTWVCVAGGLVDVDIDGRPAEAFAPRLVPAGAELRIGIARAGLRVYLAVRGGIVAPAALGSASRDVLAGLGPAPVAVGDTLRVGVPAAEIPVVDAFPWSVPPSLLEVRVTAGPRADWFAADASPTLRAATWTVSSHADRVGIRLEGPALERARHDELPSEGMRPGAIQVPPHGRPVVLLADGPVTGGYPVIAVVTDAALDALAQARPGDRVRFRGA